MTKPLFAVAITALLATASQPAMPPATSPSSLRPLMAPPPPPVKPLPPGAACPNKTPADWQRFLEGVASQQRLVETCELEDCDKHYHDFIDATVESVLKACAKEIAASPQIAKCTEHVRSYIPTWLVQHDVVGYGFTVDNKTYNAREDGPNAPKGMMTVPQPLIDALPSAARLAAAARANGFKYLTQDSMIDQGTRTFVYIPDPDGYYDKWMLFNLKDDEIEGSSDSPVSFIAVQKKDAQGNALAQVRLNFRDYYMERTPIGFDLVVHDDSNGKCYACHPSGVRRLIPRETATLREKAALPVKGDPEYSAHNRPSPAFAMKRLKEFNAKLKSYGMNDWDGMINPDDHGPIIGDEQGCTECHDDDTRGALRMSTSIKQLWEKTYYQLAMPPKDGVQALLQKELLAKATPHQKGLTADEQADLDDIMVKHRDLIEDLDASRYPTLKGWLLETACDPAPGTP